MEILTNEDHARLVANLEHSLGPVICDALKDSTVGEIMLNPDGKVWIERFGHPMMHEDTLTDKEGAFIISLVASSLELTANRKNTSIAGEFPIGSHRFQGQLPPNTPSPMFSIRKKAERVFTLDEYVEGGIITKEMKGVIEEQVKRRRNIIIAGGTGSGKTTLTNAIIHSISQISPNHRLFLLEDTYELQSQSINTVRLKATKQFPMTSQIEDTLRLRPDRIVVGEVRDEAVLGLLEAWNTGHPGGISTLYADSAIDTLKRIETLVTRKSVSPLREVIGSAIDIVIYITKANTESCRKVTEIMDLAGFDSSTQKYTKEYLYYEPPQY